MTSTDTKKIKRANKCTSPLSSSNSVLMKIPDGWISKDRSKPELIKNENDNVQEQPPQKKDVEISFKKIADVSKWNNRSNFSMFGKTPKEASTQNLLSPDVETSDVGIEGLNKLDKIVSIIQDSANDIQRHRKTLTALNLKRKREIMKDYQEKFTRQFSPIVTYEPNTAKFEQQQTCFRVDPNVVRVEETVNALKSRNTKIGNAKSFSELQMLRKQQNASDIIQKAHPEFICSDRRLENKENAHFRNCDIKNRKTMKDIVEVRKKEIDAKYKEYYDKNIIEEQEIPTYSDHCKEWWTLRRNYKTSVGEREVELN